MEVEVVVVCAREGVVSTPLMAGTSSCPFPAAQLISSDQSVAGKLEPPAASHHHTGNPLLPCLVDHARFWIPKEALQNYAKALPRGKVS